MSAGGIQAIPTTSVAKICSGQVILDLSSAVKELVENALDAGASTVEVRLKEHGLQLIEVADNGKGIPPKDHAALALKYHTSKINQFIDLQDLHTFGFRGEALSALAGLGQLTVITRTAAQAAASRLEFNSHGDLTNNSPVARAVGTTVAVKELFHTLPVRRQEFSRNVRREVTKLKLLLQQYAIMSSQAQLFASDQAGKAARTVMVSTSNAGSSMADRVSAVLGSKVSALLVPIEVRMQKEGVQITGLVSRSGCGVKGDKLRQFCCINNRPVELPRAIKVMNDTYKSLYSSLVGLRPMAFLSFDLPPGTFDINVTPDKRSVFMQKEVAIMTALGQALQALWEPSRYSYAVNPNQETFDSQQRAPGVTQTAAAAEAAHDSDEDDISDDDIPAAPRAAHQQPGVAEPSGHSAAPAASTGASKTHKVPARTGDTAGAGPPSLSSFMIIAPGDPLHTAPGDPLTTAGSLQDSPRLLDEPSSQQCAVPQGPASAGEQKCATAGQLAAGAVAAADGSGPAVGQKRVLLLEAALAGKKVPRQVRAAAATGPGAETGATAGAAARGVGLVGNVQNSAVEVTLSVPRQRRGDGGVTTAYDASHPSDADADADADADDVSSDAMSETASGTNDGSGDDSEGDEGSQHKAMDESTARTLSRHRHQRQLKAPLSMADGDIRAVSADADRKQHQGQLAHRDRSDSSRAKRAAAGQGQKSLSAFGFTSQQQQQQPEESSVLIDNLGFTTPLPCMPLEREQQQQCQDSALASQLLLASPGMAKHDTQQGHAKSAADCSGSGNGAREIREAGTAADALIGDACLQEGAACAGQQQQGCQSLGPPGDQQQCDTFMPNTSRDAQQQQQECEQQGAVGPGQQVLCQTGPASETDDPDVAIVSQTQQQQQVLPRCVNVEPQHLVLDYSMEQLVADVGLHLQRLNQQQQLREETEGVEPSTGQGAMLHAVKKLRAASLQGEAAESPASNAGSAEQPAAAAAAADVGGGPDAGTRDTATAELMRVFDKADFAHMQPVGQFNLGFIIAKLRGDLFIVDQHAADEKSTFERLLQSFTVNKQPLLCPKRLTSLTHMDQQTIRDHLDIFRRNGFDFVDHDTSQDQARASGAKQPRSTTAKTCKAVAVTATQLAAAAAADALGGAAVGCDSSVAGVQECSVDGGPVGVDGTIHWDGDARGDDDDDDEDAGSAVPELLLSAVPVLSGRALGEDVLMELLDVLAAGEACPESLRPKRVRDVLASRACRTSIMIGTPLTRQQQGRILARLAQLDAPYNCPHGRPTMRHLAVLPTPTAHPVPTG